MNGQEIENKVIDIIDDVLCVDDRGVITPEARLDGLCQEGIDSMDVLDISLAIDLQFKVSTSVDKMLTMEYVGQVINYVKELTDETTERETDTD